MQMAPLLLPDYTAGMVNPVADDSFPRHRISVDDYYRMSEVGLLACDARVELIDGEVFDMVPIGSGHAAVVNALSRLLFSAVGSRATLTVQQPVRLDRSSEPQPDLALLKPRADFYYAAHPGPADVLLLIEVCDATLRYDREVKLPLYARHAIPEVWLLDLQGRVLQRSRAPVDGRYTDATVHDRGMIEPGLLPGAVVDLSLVLGLLV
jgi:Uma2 family endonuclease